MTLIDKCIHVGVECNMIKSSMPLDIDNMY